VKLGLCAVFVIVRFGGTFTVFVVTLLAGMVARGICGESSDAMFRTWSSSLAVIGTVTERVTEPLWNALV